MGQERVVIIGAGQAGASIAMGLRAGGYGGEIMVVGEEPYLPYQRPPLSKKYLSGEWERERLLLRPDDFWRRMEIGVVTGKAIREVDPERRTVVIDGETTGWSKLAFATGTEPRPMPGGLAGLHAVHRLRTIDDVDRLGADFQPGRRLLVIGGGYIGLETAAVAAKSGLDVTVIERAPRILERVACSLTSDHFRSLHQSHGVRILEGRGLGDISSDGGRLTSVTLETGERLAADLAVVGVGVLPRIDLAERAGLRCDNGIVVDAHGRTSKDGIWAAGDCANFPFGGDRKSTRLNSSHRLTSRMPSSA
jgi:3-phenylpropionate/trans-cinnamate dioxygenase ferredoxin reductase subunit